MAEHNDTPPPRAAQHSVCRERHIKVHRSYYLRPLKRDPAGAGRPVPWIQLKGHWLRQAGFAIDAPVRVRVMAGCLVLTVEEA